jgi:diguanylate cyclase (GGDEF)-like protein
VISKPPWGARVAAVAVGACGLMLAVHLVWYVGGWGSESLRAAVTDGMYPPLALTFTLLGIRVVRNRRLDSRTRLAWSFIVASFACQLIAHTSWFVEDVILHQVDYPSFADYWFLAFVPVMFIGLMLLPGARRTRRDRIRLVLDSMIVGASTFMVLWYLVLGPIFATADVTVSEIVYSAALPVGDLLLVLALATVVLRRSGSPASTPERLLAAGVGAYVIADVYYSYIQLHDGFVGGTWPDLLWLLGCYLFALTAYRQHQQTHQTPTRPDDRVRTAAVNWLPYGATALAYGLLAVLASKEGLYPLGGMIIGALALTALVVARQVYAQRENQELAVTDTLTGLANRALVSERLARLSTQPIRAGRHSAALLVDLDRFKPINDAYGHGAGDAVLQAVAVALRSVLRASDTAGRLGGDEFAVILQNLPAPGVAVEIAERLVAALRTPVIFGEHVLDVQASIGVAIRDEDCADGAVLLQHADAAMYAAKRSGRDRMVLYTAELDTRARDAELRRAIAAEELVVYFQPAVDLDDGRIIAVEALARWAHPARGLLMPDMFIDLAEDTGAIVPLGEWVLLAACRQAAQWRATIPGVQQLRLSVNLSPKQIMQPDLVDRVSAILADTGFPARLLILELTESVILQPAPEIVARLDALRRMGIGLAVDDFGTGYSALSLLRRLPVNILKVDRSFVTGIADDAQTRSVADAIIRLGEAFNLVVVAEGIETAEQGAALREMGCRFGQGFYYYRPLDGPSAATALRSGCAPAPGTMVTSGGQGSNANLPTVARDPSAVSAFGPSASG